MRPARGRRRERRQRLLAAHGERQARQMSANGIREGGTDNQRPRKRRINPPRPGDPAKGERSIFHGRGRAWRHAVNVIRRNLPVANIGRGLRAPAITPRARRTRKTEEPEPAPNR